MATCLNDSKCSANLSSLTGLNLTKTDVVARSPLTPTGYLVSSVYLACIGTLATVGNSLVIYVICRSGKFLTKPYNTLLLNLAVADAAISVFGYPFTTASGFAGRWLFAEVGCVICGFACFTCAQTSLNTLAVISVFRYIIVCKPQYTLTRRRTRFAIAFTWLYAVFWTSPPLFGWSRYTFEPFGTSCTVDWDGQGVGEVLYSICLIIFCFLLHLAIMGYCYWHIWQVSRKLDPHLLAKTTASLDQVMRAHKVHSESKPTKMSLLMIGAFVVCWSPYALISFWAALVAPIPAWLSPFPTFFCKASCVINPLLYLATNTAFRKELKAQLPLRATRVGDRGIEIRKREGNHVNFIVDRTKDGIFIGQQQLSLELRNDAF